MKWFLFILSVLSASTGFGQRLCKGILTDSSTKQPIEFANIGVLGQAAGTVTDERGEYSFIVPDSLAGEKVRVSMVGYRAKLFPVSGFEKQTAISLAQVATVLNEVSVTAKKTKIKTIGNDTRTTNVSGGFTKNNLGAEIAIKLNIKHPQTHIRKFMVNVNRNTLNKAPIFRLNIYNMDEKGMPNQNILTQNIILEPKNLTGLIEADLSSYGIVVDKDVFIAIEWIKDLGDAKGLYFSTKLVGSATYFRQTSQAKWEKTTPIGVGLYAEVAY